MLSYIKHFGWNAFKFAVFIKLLKNYHILLFDPKAKTKKIVPVFHIMILFLHFIIKLRKYDFFVIYKMKYSYQISYYNTNNSKLWRTMNHNRIFSGIYFYEYNKGKEYT